MDAKYLWIGIGSAIAIWIIFSLIFGANNQEPKEIIIIDNNETEVIIVTNETEINQTDESVFKHNFSDQTILDH